MTTDAELVQIVDAALASATARAGQHLHCHAGCSSCCHGVFEITALDAERLRLGLAQAPAEIAHHIEARAAAARERLLPRFPGDASTGILNGSPAAIEEFEEWADSDPCPVLNPATQRCDLYAARPVLCRTFGPPIRNDADDPGAGLSLCELNFTYASEDDILGAEMNSSFRPLEAALEHATPGGPTIIAFAFVQPPLPTLLQLTPVPAAPHRG